MAAVIQKGHNTVLLSGDKPKWGRKWDRKKEGRREREVKEQFVTHKLEIFLEVEMEIKYIAMNCNVTS